MRFTTTTVLGSMLFGALCGTAWADGAELYRSTCSACHGADAKGVPNLGKDITASAFFAEKSDDELVQFINTGRAADDPANTVGIPMPPKAGNPTLTDDQIGEIIAYLRGLSS